MKRVRLIAAWAAVLSLSFGQAAYAEVVVPPLSSVSEETGETLAPAAVLSLAGTAAAEGTEDTETAADETEDAAQTGSGGETEEPELASEAGVLLDASTGEVLYGKNEDTQYYPASITKIMTALLTLENCALTDTVTFSETAVSNLEAGASSLGLVEGDELTVEQCLYGLLLKSANEIGNALAEHISGSNEDFAALMNERAGQLGCENTNFTNPHGLNDTAHLTTAHDMALIMREALKNEDFCEIDTTTSYSFPATKEAEARTITMGHKMMYPSDSRYYEGIIGGKTGYTSKARNTLVTAARRDDVTLIAVVMKSEGTHYTDTKALLDYGFENYEALAEAAQSGAFQSVSSAQGVTAGPGGGDAVTPAAVTGPGAAPGTSSEDADDGEDGEDGEETAVSYAGPVAYDDDADEADETEDDTSGQIEAKNATGWYSEDGQLYYIKANGDRASGEWLTILGQEYWFDTTGYAATGWRHFSNDDYYYFSTEDAHLLSSCWIEDSDCWYYLGEDGALLRSTTTPDGYEVNEYGIRIDNGE